MEIREREDNKEIKRLFPAYRIETNQGLWLSPEYDVWLASENDPIGDKEKIRLERGGASGASGSESIDMGTYPRLVFTNNILEMLPHSPTAADIFSRGGVFSILPGGYLNSKRNPGVEYSNALLHRSSTLARDLLQQVRPDRNIRLVKKQVQEHRYVYLEDAIIKGKAPYSEEMIFGTSRRPGIDIVQLANATDLSLVYVKGSPIQEKLGLVPDANFRSTFDEWILELKEQRVEVCTHTHTSAEHLIWDAVTDNFLDPKQFKSQVTLDDLQSWAQKNKTNGVVICDVGVAYQLIAEGKKQDLKLEMSLVPYDQPIPVGPAFPRKDQIWGDFLEHVIREVLSSKDEEIEASKADMKERFKELCINWVYPDKEAA